MKPEKFRAWVSEAGGRGRSMNEVVDRWGYIPRLGALCRELGITAEPDELSRETVKGVSMTAGSRKRLVVRG